MNYVRASTVIAGIAAIATLSLARDPEGAEGPPPKPTLADTAIVAIDTNALPALDYDAGKIRFIATNEATGGRSAVVELTEMPGYKTAWHRHDACDEAFYVLQGTLTIRIADRTHVLPAGSYVFIPRGIPHGQGNFTDQPARLLTTFTPGGFDAFFKDRVELYKRTKPGDPEFQANFDSLRARHAKWVQILGVWHPHQT